MRKNLGDKSKEVNHENKKRILDIYMDFTENEFCKIFDNNNFGYTKVQIERPLIENGLVQKLKSGDIKPDPKLRGHEKITLNDSIEKYFDTEVKPHLPDSWMDRSKDKVGYEINFQKYFYKFQPMRNINSIQNELKEIGDEINNLLKQL